jgi:hypothetical protein
VSLDDVGAFYGRLARRLHRLFKDSPDGVTSSDIWCCVTAAGDAPLGPEPFDFADHLQRQREFSERTFGPGARAKGVVAHIRKELLEIEAAPDDLAEWIDVAILALDGAWRTGATPQQIIDALVAKQTKNEARTWPDWRTMDPDAAIEHDRSGETSGALSPRQALSELLELSQEMGGYDLPQGAQSSGNSGEVTQGEAFQLSQGFVDRVTTDDAKEPPVMGAGSHDSIKRIAEEMVHACKVVRQGDGEFTHDAVDDWAHRIMCFADYTHPAERAAVPEGWVLVPREPTAEMLDCVAFPQWPEDSAAGKELQRKRGTNVVFPKAEIEVAVGQYQRMLSAAPTLAGKEGTQA